MPLMALEQTLYMDMGLYMLEQKNKLLDLLKQLDQGQQLGGGSTALDLELFLPPSLRVLLVLEMEGMLQALHPDHDPLTHEHLTLYH